MQIIKYILYVGGVVLTVYLAGIATVAFLNDKIDKRTAHAIKEAVKKLPQGPPGPPGIPGDKILVSDEIIIDSDRPGTGAVAFSGKKFNPAHVKFCFVTVHRPPEPEQMHNIKALEARKNDKAIRIIWDARGRFRLHARVYAVIRGED